MTKIDIISGFLGAGKTTFIKKLLQEAISGEQVVLIENEFGEIGIDGGFLKDSGIEIREMNSGCICCSLVGDFGKSLAEVLTTYKPDRIIIEPSGVGKLSDVMKAVIDVSADMDVALNSAVTIVDAAKCKMYMKNFGEFFSNQIEYAGTIILSRTDTEKATEEKIVTAVEIIHQIPVGRLNDNLSINVFDLVSLSPSNAVPKYARFDVEIRCFGNDIKQEIRDRIRRKAEETAERMGCKCNIREEEDVPETDFSENTDMLERLASIYSRSGLSMIPARSFGVLDATCTNQLGIRTVPIGFNIYHSHSAREYVVIEDVKKMLELVENIIRYF